MEHFWNTIKVGIAWVLTLIAGVSLNDVAIFLALTYSILQITSFFYPWHKVLWKKLGFKE